jgi:hypothetical protein
VFADTYGYESFPYFSARNTPWTFVEVQGGSNMTGTDCFVK